MIGLKRHTVKIVDHHPSWKALADEACRHIRCATVDLLTDVQHVGSTAVPGLCAKPILDLAATFSTKTAIPVISQRLTRSGYIYRGDGGNEGGHLFIWESSPNIRTIHLHIVEENDPQWVNYIRFRDLLRQYPEILKIYSALKQRLKDTFPNDRNSYTNEKKQFILQILETRHIVEIPGTRKF